MVFLWHAPLTENLIRPYSLGYAGVAFFFLLSGFILSYSYQDQLSSWNLRRTLSFYAARIAKIMPVHLLTLGLAVLLIPLAGIISGSVSLPPNAARNLLLDIFLLQSFVPDNEVNFSYNGVAWSISSEMFFYALFPFAIWFLIRLHRRIGSAALVCAAASAWMLHSVWLWGKDAKLDEWAYYIFPPVRFLDFCAGVCLGLVFTRAIGSGRVPSRLGATFVELAAVAAVGLSILMLPHVPQALRFGAFLMPAMALLVYVFAHQRGLLSHLLSRRPLLVLGEISFSFYMLHQLVIRYLKALGYSETVITYGGLALSLALSMWIYYMFEEPMRQMTKKALSRLINRSRKSREAQVQPEAGLSLKP